jgi:hypothetical protein
MEEEGLIEVWKPIKQFPAYAISNMGRVKRITPAPGTWIGKILNPILTPGGYHIIGLRNGNGSKIRIPLHRIVLESFVRKRPKGKECNHKDGNKTNNYVGNLEWVTPKENAEHAFKTGLRKKGLEHPSTKLKEGEIYLARKLGKAGISCRKVAKMFNISPSMANAIARNKIWRGI